MIHAQDALLSLKEKRIFFGHQSVGGEVVNGIEALSRHAGVPINLAALNGKAAPTSGPGFFHDSVGTNGAPESKNSAFSKAVNEQVGVVDIAFFKYCYIDINAGTDVGKMFDQYQNTMTGLKRRHPKTIFVHVTDPLTSVQTGPKAWLKRLLGKPLGGYEDNRKRNEFNDRMRKQYAGKEPLFDLAQLEAQRPNGTFETFSLDGKQYYAMAPDYTYDGGHLNEVGQRKTAEALVVYLSTLVRKTR